MRLTVYTLAVLVAAYACSPGAAQPLPCPDDSETLGLASQFRALRTTRGQFEGGEWNDDVDAWMGRKHTLMIELASRLSENRCDKTELAELLGSSDRISKRGEPEFERLAAPTLDDAVDDVLVYHWRGAHDFLFFTCDGNRITGSHWWHAGE